MASENALQVQARRLQREIAQLNRAITQASAYNQEDRREKLETLRTIKALRERELDDVAARLAAIG